MADDIPEAVTIRRTEYEALLRIVGAVEEARYLQTSHGWVEALDLVWTALGAYYQLIPARRPSGVRRVVE